MLQEITVVNNRTNKEYTFKSENDYGLDWKFYNENQIFDVRQLIEAKDVDGKRKHKTLGIFRDFSICKTVRRTIE